MERFTRTHAPAGLTIDRDVGGSLHHLHCLGQREVETVSIALASTVHKSRKKLWSFLTVYVKTLYAEHPRDLNLMEVFFGPQ